MRDERIEDAADLAHELGSERETPARALVGRQDGEGVERFPDHQQTGTADPSLWLMDARGAVREFKLSDRDGIKALNETDRQNGVGLAGRERAQSCG